MGLKGLKRSPSQTDGVTSTAVDTATLSLGLMNVRRHNNKQKKKKRPLVLLAVKRLLPSQVAVRENKLLGKVRCAIKRGEYKLPLD